MGLGYLPTGPGEKWPHEQGEMAKGENSRPMDPHELDVTCGDRGSQFFSDDFFHQFWVITHDPILICAPPKKKQETSGKKY